MVTGNRLSARFRNAAIKKKLIVLMLVITSVSLLLSGASFITLDYLHARERFVDKMRTLSDVMATNVAAPLVQGDPDAAKDTLMSMKVAELVMNVFIHSADGKLLVQYCRQHAICPVYVPDDLSGFGTPPSHGGRRCVGRSRYRD